MKKFLIAIAVVSLGLFSSCDKCKDKTCENTASCDKKTGDCSNVCLNGGTSDASTGSCACPDFFNGGTCSNEVRNDYVGTYIGTSTTIYEGISFSEADTYKISLAGINPKMMFFDDAEEVIELSSNTAFGMTLVETDSVSGDVESIVVTGTFGSSSISIDITESYEDEGATLTASTKFTGTKQ